MAKPTGIARLSKGLIGRLMMVVVVIHAILVPLLFIGVLYIVKQGYESLFINQVRSESHMLAVLAGRDLRPARLQTLFEEVALSGSVVFWEVADTSGQTIARAHGSDVRTNFKEDFFFDEYGDTVYYVSVPVNDDAGMLRGVLRLGYDETPTQEQIDNTYHRGFYLAIGYILLTLFLAISGGRILYMMRKELVTQASALEHQALHDTLTGLPNRALLHDRLKQSILASQREHAPFALFLMDLDRFKEVNDTLGHPAGDVILQQTAARLREAVRESDTVARLGGDEFAVVLPKVDVDDAVLIAEKILRTLQEPFLVESRTLPIGASIGIALFPGHGEDAASLLSRADVAMYAAKHAGGGLTVYDPDLDRHSMDRLTLTAELRQGIDHDEIEVYYQPKADLHTGEICGVEALARWRHPRLGLILPEEFIPLAERAGIINTLTLRIIEASARQCAHWSSGGRRISVAVNLSPLSLLDAKFSEKIAEIIRNCGLSACTLILEVTEGAIMADTPQVQELFAHLDAMGVRISIDDFGTGYSSLARLKKLPVSEVKIDKSFVIDMLTDDNDAAIVRATIDLAHTLGIKVVAEGVETQGHLEMLAAFGCDMAQGYHISRPLPTLEIQHLLAVGRNIITIEGTEDKPLFSGL